MASLSESLFDGFAHAFQVIASRHLIVLTIAAIFILFVYNYATHPTKTMDIPAGPVGLPIVGLIPWVVWHKLHGYAWKLSEKYGKIFTLVIGKYNIVIINDYDWVKELSLNPDFQGRSDNDFFHEYTSGLGIVNAEGSLWKHQRRFTFQALKDAGMGTLQLQDKIKEELSKVLTEIDTFLDGPIPIQQILEKATSNIISAIAFSKRYDYRDPDFIKRVHGMNYNFKIFALMQICSAFRWLYPIAKAMLFKKIHKHTEDFKQEGMKFIEEHRRTLDEPNPRDLIDLYLMEMQKSEEDKYETGYLDTFFVDQLLRLIVDLFGAGTETSSTTIRWAILYMIHHPDVQKKIQEELDDVIGTERMPTMEDKQSLPYSVATLQEVERLSSVAPLSLARSNPRAAEFHGYKFKPRQLFHFNMYSIHRDPKLWENPLAFNPKRYIDDQGNIIRPLYLMPFGSGRRMCPGEALAKAEIFLIFTTLMHRYRFKAVDPKRTPAIKDVFGFIRGPIAFDVKVDKRF